MLVVVLFDDNIIIASFADEMNRHMSYEMNPPKWTPYEMNCSMSRNMRLVHDHPCLGTRWPMAYMAYYLILDWIQWILSSPSDTLRIERNIVKFIDTNKTRKI